MNPMKTSFLNLTLVASFVISLSCLAVAQNNNLTMDAKNKSEKKDKSKAPKTKSSNDPHAMMTPMKLDPSKEYALIMNGKTFIKKNQTLNAVDTKTSMGEMEVSPDGKITRKDGSVTSLKEGEAMSTEGYIVVFDPADLMHEKMKQMDQEHAMMMNDKKNLEQTMMLMNQKMDLINRKTNLVNEKMKMMVQMMDEKNKKSSKEKIEGLNRGIIQLDQEITNAEAKIEQLDNQLSSKASVKK
jgi:hypothetical protein